MIKPKVLRYVVRPRHTIKGWYVWPVVVATHASDCDCSAELENSHEQWGDHAYAQYQTKQEAKAVAKLLNDITAKARRAQARRRMACKS